MEGMRGGGGGLVEGVTGACQLSVFSRSFLN